jgi:hypothetical protein
MSRLDNKVAELKNQGWVLINYGENRINSNTYKYAILEKDGERVVVNHQGGTKGLISASASRSNGIAYNKKEI